MPLNPPRRTANKTQKNATKCLEADRTYFANRHPNGQFVNPKSPFSLKPRRNPSKTKAAEAGNLLLEDLILSLLLGMSGWLRKRVAFEGFWAVCMRLGPEGLSRSKLLHVFFV